MSENERRWLTQSWSFSLIEEHCGDTEVTWMEELHTFLGVVLGSSNGGCSFVELSWWSQHVTLDSTKLTSEVRDFPAKSHVGSRG